MNSSSKVVLIALSWQALGCATAQMVETRGGADYGELDPKRGGGLVRYPIEGGPSRVAANRREAYREMHAYCRGPYEIAREWVEADSQLYGHSTVPGAVELTIGTSFPLRARSVEFRCRPDVASDSILPTASLHAAETPGPSVAQVEAR
jgi:hypothetical protein